MKEFTAKNSKQLDICLKLLYAEKISFVLVITENDKRKIEYAIRANVDDSTFEQLRETYRILIS